MEKLIVKNFGPIKEAEIDLTKYVVFIGDTSTGKSVLAKLIAIFRDAYNKLNILDNHESDFEDELKKFNINFNFSKSTIEYYFDSGSISLKLENGKIKLLQFALKGALSKAFEIMTGFQMEKLKVDEPQQDWIGKNKDAFMKMVIDNTSNQLLTAIKSVYFPAERITYVLLGNALAGLSANNIALPECYKDFGAEYEVARNELNSFQVEGLGIGYKFSNGVEEIIQDNDIRLKLSQTSSGIQSLIPLLLVLKRQVSLNDTTFTKSFVFEEPELNLFPTKQKQLVEYIISLMNTSKAISIFTTHSPYILSVLDTLMLAKNTYNEHPDLKEEISAIVSEDKWIDYNDISVYEVRNDGTIKSIKNEEFKSIDTNAIDGVSDIISEEFDKLTELRYAQ